jgi:hypothetical protein
LQVIADFCLKRNWNLRCARTPFITQSIEFSGNSKITHSSEGLLTVNMVHVGPKVKKIRTPWYVEVNKKNILIAHKKVRCRAAAWPISL